ncbi:hypothetical protein [Bradyrhizobium sp. Bra64]|uniref:hypothetical protein n=1 Tax=Bradyrhizobium sp. Bra64 TaxID=2926009 RepID=UPI00211896BC|nr:hypothetical protein [Bradyrhizobium sp. Bra64]
MPTTRVPIHRPPQSRVTNEARALFARALGIEANDDHQFWEEDGGNRRQYLDLAVELHRLLGLTPWQMSPIDVVGERPDWLRPEDWQQASELRAELIGA